MFEMRRPSVSPLARSETGENGKNSSQFLHGLLTRQGI